ncbi:MAG: helix-turn-helix domain-containing protein [Lentisphaeria bacterium]|nr:helix-turn-helix domain-containing protein [Lentisphaeria bacterium]
MSSSTANFVAALREAVHRAGSQTALARSAGMQQSRISDYLSGRYEFGNITIGTLEKLFPELQFVFFPSAPYPSSGLESEMEKQILEHFRRLSPAEKARYMMVVAAAFPVEDHNSDS